MAERPGAEICANCKGKGHGAAQCTSKGGGKWIEPKGKGKGDGGKGYGKPGYGGKGIGKSGDGKGGFGKGKGKGKGVYGMDDQQWPGAEWGQQWPEWPPAQSSAAAAPPPQSPFPSMSAAATSAPSDPWSAWPPSAGGFHSLAPVRILPKKMPVAPIAPPISTQLMFGALCDNIGAAGQKSQISMSFGEVAKIVPQMSRRRKEPVSRVRPHGVKLNVGIVPGIFSHFIRLLLMSGFFIDWGLNIVIWCVFVTDSVCIPGWCVLLYYGLTFVYFGYSFLLDIFVLPRRQVHIPLRHQMTHYFDTPIIPETR